MSSSPSSPNAPASDEAASHASPSLPMNQPHVTKLATMDDLDVLSADLDAIDVTLADLDKPGQIQPDPIEPSYEPEQS